MDRAKIVFIGIAVVAIGAASVLGYLAKGKFDEASEASLETKNSYDRLNGIYSKEVFPSAENINLLRESFDALEGCRGEITNALTGRNIPMTTSVSPSAFVQALSQQIKTKADKAPIVGGVKSVSPTFAFGFDAYVGSNPAMPLENEVPTLSQQLILISWLVDEFYSSGVSSITKIERTPFDQASQLKNPQSVLLAEIRSAQSDEEEPEPVKKGKKKSKKKVQEDRPPLFTKQKLLVEFSARQQSLVTFLNSVASMKKAFIIVTDMEIKKASSDIKDPAQVEAKAASLSASQEEDERLAARTRERPKDRKAARAERSRATKEKTEVVKEISDLPKEMRIMSGPDVDPLLLVKLSLEVYNFGKEAE